MNKDTKNALVSFALVMGIVSAGSVMYSQKVQAEQVLMKKESGYTEQQKESELIMQELIAQWSTSEEIKEASSSALNTEKPVIIESTKVVPVVTQKKVTTTSGTISGQTAVDAATAQAKADALAQATLDARAKAAAQAQADALAQQIADAKRAAATLAAKNAAMAAKRTAIQPSRVSTAS